MIWRLEELRKKDLPLVLLNGKWVPARPIGGTFIDRICEAWLVLKGKADVFIWPEKQ